MERQKTVERPALVLINLCGLVLPALFSLGYPIFSLEILIVVLALAAIAAVVGTVLRHMPLYALNLVCASLAALSVHIYSGIHIGDAWSIGIAVAIFVLAIVLSEGFAVIASAAAVGSFAFAALNGPILIRNEPAKAQVTSAKPTVIHIILDEYGAHSSYPLDIIPKATVDKLDLWYQTRGFVHAKQAYSTEQWTHRSVALMLNHEVKNAESALRKNDPHLDLSSWNLNQASHLAALAASRRLSLVTTTYINIAAATRNITNMGPVLTYDHSIPSPTLSVSGMALGDRMRVMTALVSSWLYLRQKVSLYKYFLDQTSVGNSVRAWQQAKDRLQPLTSTIVFQDLVQRTIPAAGRGEYIFAHLLLPHHPYVYDRSCNLRPVADWLNPFRWPDKDTMADRAQRYPLYLEQVECTLTKLDTLLAAIDRNPALSDATLILHGDHGTRIGMNTAGKPLASLLDWHPTLVAVRFPDRAPRIFDRAVDLQDVMHDLLRNDFQTLKEETIPIQAFGKTLYPN
jgi:hypothetical protein